MVALGTIDDPLVISDAMDYEWIRPGHTVWLRGGVYDAQSSLTCMLAGIEGKPITVRNYPGEVAQIDAELMLSCPYTRWMSDDYGLEVIGTATNRYSEQEGSAPADLEGHGGVYHGADSLELINVRIIDVSGSGLFFFGYSGLIYGCHIIHCGWIAPDRVHGPGIYTHNNAAKDKRIDNTVIVNPFRYALQMVSGSTNRVLNYDIVDTTVVGTNVVIGGTSSTVYPTMDDVNITRLMLYGGIPMIAPWLHYERGDRCTLADSVVRHGSDPQAFTAKRLDRLTISGCRFSSETYTLDECEPTITDCTFGSLSGVDANLVPNTYAPNFATLTVFDWDASGTVNIDVSAFVASGTVRVHNIILMRSEYRDVEVVAGVLALDMTGWTTPPPLGLDTRLTDAYPGDFGCWILEKLA